MITPEQKKESKNSKLYLKEKHLEKQIENSKLSPKVKDTLVFQLSAVTRAIDFLEGRVKSIGGKITPEAIKTLGFKPDQAAFLQKRAKKLASLTKKLLS